MCIAILLIIGMLVGSFITTIALRFFVVGTLRIDTSDPEDGPYIFLELSKGMESISSKKYVLLKVNLKNYVSHK